MSTYKIVRKYADFNHPDTDTSEKGVWFDSFYKED
jgi:hypothetical protein